MRKRLLRRDVSTMDEGRVKTPFHKILKATWEFEFQMKYSNRCIFLLKPFFSILLKFVSFNYITPWMSKIISSFCFQESPLINAVYNQVIIFYTCKTKGSFSREILNKHIYILVLRYLVCVFFFKKKKRITRTINMNQRGNGEGENITRKNWNIVIFEWWRYQ